MLIVNLRQNEAEFDKMSDESSELMQISGETRFSASVQQITSRFQSIQATAKVNIKNVIFVSSSFTFFYIKFYYRSIRNLKRF